MAGDRGLAVVDGHVARSLRESPVRSELARRLRGGDSAVWVLVESGNEEKDRERLRLLHIRWADLHEEQAALVNELIRYPSAETQTSWDRYESVLDQKAEVMERIRELHERLSKD